MKQATWVDVETPLGRFLMVQEENQLVRVLLPDAHPDPQRLEQAGYGEAEYNPHDRFLANVAKQVQDYAVGARRGLEIPFSLHGTDFHRAAWEAMREIPYGQTASYGELAARLGRPGGARAVGNACNRNPLPLLVPCHRVLASSGGLGGFGGGIDLKRSMLELEGALSPVMDSVPPNSNASPVV